MASDVEKVPRPGERRRPPQLQHKVRPQLFVDVRMRLRVVAGERTVRDRLLSSRDVAGIGRVRPSFPWVRPLFVWQAKVAKEPQTPLPLQARMSEVARDPARV